MHICFRTFPWLRSSPSAGYSRVILAAVALYFMSYHPKYCTIAYCVSCLLDAADGHAARALGQTSKFGAVLDMVTDRSVSPPFMFHARLTRTGTGARHRRYYAICRRSTRNTP